MEIGTIGAGDFAQAFAKRALKAGHKVKLSNSRGPESLREIINQLGPGAMAATTEEAAACEVVLLAVPWEANRERQGALTESRTTIAGDPFYREWLCGAGQGCRGRILERLYIDNCLPLTVELFRQLAFFILSCKPISYCRFKRIDVYIL